MSDLSKRIADLSPEKLELLLRATRRRGEVVDEQIPRRVDATDTAPLSFSQQRLWFIDQLDPGNPCYNIALAVRLRGRLNVAAFGLALNALVRRQAALRTSFVTRDGVPVQLIAPRLRLRLPVVDLRQLGGRERPAVARALATAEARRPFTLSCLPLVRTTLLRLGDDEHVLLLIMHHGISDGWSLEVLIKELATLYRAIDAGAPPPLADLPIQYADFASWQRREAHSLRAPLDYWRAALAGAPPLRLPIDHPRPPTPTFRGALYSASLPTSLAQQLHALGRQEQATLFMTLLAAFKLLLSRYTGQTDIVIGTDVANRDRSELEGLIGLFINQVVLRSDLAGRPTFRELLCRVRASTLAAFHHAGVPFDELVGALKPRREPNRNPLFQVAFLLQRDFLASLPPLPGVRVELLEIDNQTAKLDLTVLARETPQALELTWNYNTDLFDATTIQRMMAQFAVLLADIARDDARVIDRLAILSPAQRQQLLGDFSLGPALAHDGRCIHQLIEEQAARTPDAVALVFDAGPTNDEGRTTNRDLVSPVVHRPSSIALTYRDLNARANRLAHYLRRLGLGPDDLAALCVERSPELIAGMLGILKAGGAYVPLDPLLPQQRLRAILEDTQPRVLLTRRSFAAQVPSAARLVCLQADAAAIAAGCAENLPALPADAGAAYVLFTSGSTGRPKGIVIEHRQLVSYTRAILERLECPPGAGFALVQPVAFDSSVTMIYPALCSGGCLHLIDMARAADPGALGVYMRRYAIDHLKITPAHLAALLGGPHPERVLPRQLVLGGEVSQTSWAAHVQALRPDCAIFNHYGPTETTVGVLTYRLVAAQRGAASGTLPIGRPLAGVQVYVLDPDLQPAPIGVAGELYIGGAQVARGYLNRPDLTAAAFVPNPFSQGLGVRGQESEDERRMTNDEAGDLVSLSPCHLATAGTRLYKTGDLARYLPTGAIEFLGRVDHQVKIRGFRVELGEIEAVLAQHESIRRAAVVTRQDANGQPALVAYIVPAEGTGDRRQATGDNSPQSVVRSPQSNDTRMDSDPSSIVHHPSSSDGEGADSSIVLRPSSFVSELKSFLKERLPEYMIPAHIVAVAELPRTSHGKIDRRALPAPDPASLVSATTYTAPQTDAELRLAAIWQAALRLERVGVHDNFFDIGGHSLMLVRVHSEIQQSFAVSFPLTEMFNHPTIAALTAYLGAMPASEPALHTSQDRAEKQRAALRRRRQQKGTGHE